MDKLNISSVIENLRKQTETAQIDASNQQQHWSEVRLRAEGGLIMLGEIEKALGDIPAASAEASK